MRADERGEAEAVEGLMKTATMIFDTENYTNHSCFSEGYEQKRDGEPYRPRAGLPEVDRQRWKEGYQERRRQEDQIAAGVPVK